MLRRWAFFLDFDLMLDRHWALWAFRHLGSFLRGRRDDMFGDVDDLNLLHFVGNWLLDCDDFRSWGRINDRVRHRIRVANVRLRVRVTEPRHFKVVMLDEGD